VYTTKFNGIQWHTVAIFATTSIFVISTSNLEDNLIRFMALIL